MKITRLKLRDLRNDEFFQFMTRVRDMVTAATPAALRVERIWGEFTASYARLDEALKKIMKSALTARINEADAARDEVFRGLAATHKAAQNHFNAAIRAAAERLEPVFTTYGNVAARPHDEETSAVYNLCKELVDNHAEDCTTLALVPWIQELSARNRAVEALMMTRFEEGTARTDLVMREVRLEIGEVWYRLADRIDSLQNVLGEDDGAPWAAFIDELNEIIARTENIVAARRGRAAAAAAEKKAKAEAAANGGGNAPAPAPEE